MPLRTLLLRVLFWSLALAAVFGAVGVLFSSYDTIWRVAATSFTTSVAAVLLLAASAQMDKPAARRAALLAATLVVAVYLLTLGAVWRADALLGGGRDDELWFTAFAVAAVGVPAVAFLRMTATPAAAVAGRVGLAAAAAELLLALTGIWLRVDWFSSGSIVELAFVLPPFAALAVLCLIGQGVPPARPWRWIGVAAAAAGLAMGSYGVFASAHYGEDLFVYVVCAAAAVAHANVVTLLPLKPAQAWLRWLTVAAGVATAVFIGLATGGGLGSGGAAARLAAACGIVAGCGTLALALLARLNRRFVVPAGALAGVAEITVLCPLCRRKQSLPLGEARCVECGVIIRARVEEPRCATCGYSLLMLKSPACPECGTPVGPFPPAPPEPVPS